MKLFELGGEYLILGLRFCQLQFELLHLGLSGAELSQLVPVVHLFGLELLLKLLLLSLLLICCLGCGIKLVLQTAARYLVDFPLSIGGLLGCHTVGFRGFFLWWVVIELFGWAPASFVDQLLDVSRKLRIGLVSLVLQVFVRTVKFQRVLWLNRAVCLLLLVSHHVQHMASRCTIPSQARQIINSHSDCFPASATPTGLTAEKLGF